SSSGYKERLRGELQGRINNGSMSIGKAQYWSSTHEVFARSFERFVQDKLHSMGRENTYLSGGKPSPLWPTGSEVKQMTPAFEKVMQAAKEKYPTLNAWMEQFHKAFDGVENNADVDDELAVNELQTDVFGNPVDNKSFFSECERDPKTGYC